MTSAMLNISEAKDLITSSFINGCKEINESKNVSFHSNTNLNISFVLKTKGFGPKIAINGDEITIALIRFEIKFYRQQSSRKILIF